ncbi:transposase [Arthrobacter sp. GMC3]|uniref:transposase n=1 Tax=Arthrobacter sp. GMC3 TaxID=2058894 RepID=UPI000CE37485|nr:transposase [Arthrobacter sp. GMC3]
MTPEKARLGRTLKSWCQENLAYFITQDASNGPTEDSSGFIETTLRIARGFRNFANYRLRDLLSAGGQRPYRNQPVNHA